MRDVFRSVGRAFHIPFINVGKSNARKTGNIPLPAIVYDDHSKFSNCQWLLDDSRSRILHIIRDPRDVLISAMNYHRSASEKWLHEPRKIFGGLTYQQKLNAFPDDRARYLFEMQKSSMRAIRGMQNWNYARENSLECKYENLMADAGTNLTREIFVHLGFEPDEIEPCRTIFWQNSLFGDLQGSRTEHIRSGQARQWRNVFDDFLARAFIERFPDVLVQLGYEPDDVWVERCGAESQSSRPGYAGAGRPTTVAGPGTE